MVMLLYSVISTLTFVLRNGHALLLILDQAPLQAESQMARQRNCSSLDSVQDSVIVFAM